MESTLSLSTRTSSLALFTLSKALSHHFSKRLQSAPQCFPLRAASSSLTGRRRTLYGLLHPRVRPHLHCFSTSTPSFGSAPGAGGGDFGGNGSGGGGGGGGDPDAGGSKSQLSGGGVEGVSAWSPDVIILDVGV